MKKIFPNDLHSITQLFIRLILLNVLFLLFISPLVLFVSLIGIAQIDHYPFLLFLVSLTVPAAAVALFRSMFTLIDQPDEAIYKLFFRSYKQAFTKEISPLLMIHLLLFLLSFDGLLYSVFPSLTLLSPLYFILRFISLTLYPIYCLEIALFKNPVPVIAKNGLILFFSKPFLILLTVLYFLFALLILSELPAALLLFTFSLFCYLYISFDYISLTDRIAKSNSQKGTEKNDFSTNI
ncbi:hypothetical protein BAU15_10970 [Enterococcus sp. JM4C]|uniref:DUF624 domain-containing protein n=1 Tax=Candidatus Enterococcus huntleyi TaxID=1857217 RepID=UPI00137B24B1|nr:DUF624 domain-containing protein [Enterococcus sp. JM4C]KAF1298640.1 hypothetical protein BAU15_10970 [Enterococcus sp. JM4C]